MVKAISILGSTGSIGRQTADAAGRLGIPVLALAARRDVDLLEKQARLFRPKLIGVYEPEAARVLRTRLADTDIVIEEGEEGLIAAALAEGANCVVTGVSKMGKDEMASFTFGPIAFHAYIDLEEGLKEGQKVSLGFKNRGVFVFDRESGVRLK